MLAPISMLGELIADQWPASALRRAARVKYRCADLHRRRRPIHRRHLREPQLRRGAEARAGAHRRKQSLGNSTPSDIQFTVQDLAERAIAYGIHGVIDNGTDPCQVYDTRPTKLASAPAAAKARRSMRPR